ncbi:methylthioribose kinase [Ectobacillus sp. JY-23]|uniref:DUF7147 family protein n=1 Tax=Ectobacillus sp. JY-23 TaxID=2933872 RepID=UPI001FF3AE25|nr:methylthioribose kinase [Ectobacillus sp. JY-23]UOY93751.1 methylthioribose kinase [Ectobacillus sp. JY-23]
MIQRFIELGEGYSDLYELLAIARANESRLAHMLMFTTKKQNRDVCSLAVVLHPTTPGDFQPLYICREGIPVLPDRTSKRIQLFEETAQQLDKPIITISVKPSDTFAETTLYYNHLIAILRLNHLIPPMK